MLRTRTNKRVVAETEIMKGDPDVYEATLHQRVSSCGAVATSREFKKCFVLTQTSNTIWVFLGLICHVRLSTSFKPAASSQQ